MTLLLLVGSGCSDLIVAVLNVTAAAAAAAEQRVAAVAVSTEQDYDLAARL
jgi:hypothetical protein